MGHILSSILFAISANLDNFTVGIAYGVKNMKIPKSSNLLIAIVSAIGTILSMSIGVFVTKFIPSDIADMLGAFILVLLAMWFLIDFVRKTRKKISETNISNKNILDDPCEADKDKSGVIDIKESVILAFALTINNFGLGIGASITGLSISLTTIFTFIFSILAVIIGTKLGKGCFAKVLGKYAPLVSALMILFLGLYEMII